MQICCNDKKSISNQNIFTINQNDAVFLTLHFLGLADLKSSYLYENLPVETTMAIVKQTDTSGYIVV